MATESLYWLVQEIKTGNLFRYYSSDGKIRKGYGLVRKYLKGEEMMLKRIIGSS